MTLEQMEKNYAALKTVTDMESLKTLLVEMYSDSGITRQQLDVADADWDSRVYDREKRRRKCDVLLQTAGKMPASELYEETWRKAVELFAETTVEMKAEEEAKRL